jgi:hypothetical protein
MSRRTRPAAALAAALAAAALTGGLTGCSTQDRLGAAAVVDGHRITTDEVQQSTREYLKVVPEAEQRNAQLRILERMILSRVIDKEARKVGVHASPGEVARERDDLLGSVGGRKGLIRQLGTGQAPIVLAPSYVDRWFKDRVLYTKIVRKLAAGADPQTQQAADKANREFIKTGRAMDIEVSPRYGTWSSRTGLTPLESGGLAKTAAQIENGS